MKQYVLLTFGFLGFAFYELSGGADYEPRLEFASGGALSAAPDVEVTRLALADTATLAEKPASDDINHQLEQAVLEALLSTKSAMVTAYEPVATTSLHRVKVTLPVAPQSAAAQTVAAVTPEPEPTPEPTAEPEQSARIDLRSVARDRVNLRSGPGTEFDVMGRLTRGTTVMVLEEPGDGWVMLQIVPGGKIGWTADWLLSKDG
ncbi:SH3 domain-containing protein [Primorskyibacter aestuariivivens]|uniref:SH3 domain-containing protein n=1 Tax=Primorskyibacter aestuariivivens TaxID=1888912 RepID=UPI002301FAD6|nr:SH3 domain-containing protein [Primorskyibacter aestuariivivens]MDA7429649.1 SH3 domain-containing protein [Primorskyibacter aestuariivivens]